MRPRRLPMLPLVLLGMVVSAVGGLAAANLYLAVDPDEVASAVRRHASEALGRPVTVGDASISLWPRPSVRITDVRIGSPVSFGDVTSARVETLGFDVAWLPLVIGRVSIHRVVLEGPSLHLAVDEHGSSNFGDLVPERITLGDGAFPAAVSWRPRSVVVRSGSVSYFDAQSDHSFLVTGWAGEVSVVRDGEGGWSTQTGLRSDSLLVRSADLGGEPLRRAGPELRLTARSDGAPGRVALDEGIVVLHEDTLGVRGTLQWEGSHAGFDIHVGNDALPADVLTALLPLDTRARLLPVAEGRLGVSLRVFGGGGVAPSLRGAVRLDDVTIRLAGEPLLERMRGVVTLNGDTLELESVMGEFAGGPMDLSGRLARRGGVATIDVTAEPDLAQLHRLGFTPLDLSGSAYVQVTVAGPLRSPDSLAITGTVLALGLRLEHTRLGAPLYVPSGKATLLPGEAHWASVQVLLGEDELVTTGSLRQVSDLWSSDERVPFVDMSITSAHLDLDAALPERPSTSRATYAQIALAHVGSRLIDDRPAAAHAVERRFTRPDRLPFHGSVELDVDSLLHHEQALDSVRARIELSDSSLSVSRASFGAWGGRTSGSLHLAVGGAPSGAFALALSVDGVEAASFLTATIPFDSTISGTLDVELDVEGSTDASLLPHAEDLTGRFAFALSDGRLTGTGINLALADFLASTAWEDVAVTHWALDALVASGGLEISEGRLETVQGDVSFTGPLRPDGSADLALAVSIPPERLEGISLRRTGVGQGVLDRLRAAGGTLELGLRLSGRIQAPTLEPDASSAVAVARTSP